MTDCPVCYANLAALRVSLRTTCYFCSNGFCLQCIARIEDDHGINAENYPRCPLCRSDFMLTVYTDQAGRHIILMDYPVLVEDYQLSNSPPPSPAPRELLTESPPTPQSPALTDTSSVPPTPPLSPRVNPLNEWHSCRSPCQLCHDTYPDYYHRNALFLFQQCPVCGLEPSEQHLAPRALANDMDAVAEDSDGNDVTIIYETTDDDDNETYIDFTQD